MRNWISGVFLAVMLLSPAAAVARTPGAEGGVASDSSALSRRKLELAQRYFKAMHLDTTMHSVLQATMSNVTPAMTQRLKALPGLTKEQSDALFEAVMESSMASTEKIMPIAFERMIPIYAEGFTEQELQSLVDFYESPIGQSIIAKTPAVSVEAAKSMRDLIPSMLSDLGPDVVSRLCRKTDCAKLPVKPKDLEKAMSAAFGGPAESH